MTFDLELGAEILAFNTDQGTTGYRLGRLQVGIATHLNVLPHDEVFGWREAGQIHTHQRSLKAFFRSNAVRHSDAMYAPGAASMLSRPITSYIVTADTRTHWRRAAPGQTVHTSEYGHLQ